VVTTAVSIAAVAARVEQLAGRIKELNPSDKP
jgi:hypothetical protein